MLEVVPFEEKHIPIFTVWFNALPGNDVWTESWVRFKTVAAPSYDPELSIVAMADGEPVGFLLGHVAKGDGWINAFIVRPDWRRRRVGTMIFDRIEQAFADRNVETINAGRATPRYFLPGIDLRYTDAIVFLDRRGYSTNRQTRVNMDVPLVGCDFDTNAEEGRLLERGIAVRVATRDDIAAITRLCEREEHFGWIVEADASLGRDPGSLFVAERDGEICAFATHGAIGPTHFGPMLTASDLRGLGVGSVLLKRCLQNWQKEGHTVGEIIWAGPLAFYSRSVGATVGKAFWTFHKPLRDAAG